LRVGGERGFLNGLKKKKWKPDAQIGPHALALRKLTVGSQVPFNTALADLGKNTRDANSENGGKRRAGDGKGGHFLGS